jgi:hypothetical protein
MTLRDEIEQALATAHDASTYGRLSSPGDTVPLPVGEPKTTLAMAVQHLLNVTAALEGVVLRLGETEV